MMRAPRDHQASGGRSKKVTRSQGVLGADVTPMPSLGQLVGRIEHRLRRRIEQSIGMDGLNLEQWRTLDLLVDGDGHSMTEIAGHVMVPAPTLTKIVDRLVESALVFRRPDERDRRRVLVFLSDRGRELHRRLAPDVQQAEHELAATLGPDAHHLLVLLHRLAT
jgi:MarR family transcriptional regulator, organic hydroperoxide resistance regulator